MLRRRALRIGCPLLLVLLAGRTTADEPTPAQVVFFEMKIRPVLVEHCYKCHSAARKSPKGELRLDSRAALLKGGETGPVVVPGHPEKSRLLDAVRYKTVDLQMPPKGKLPAAVVADLEAWVKMGVPWPKETVKVATDRYAFDLAKRKQEHWAWQPLRPTPPPAVKTRQWPAGPVDQFLLAKLEAKGLKPAAVADRRTLLRRLYFDLIGLPPTPAEVAAFVNDQAPDAVEKVVDRLLASPHFGERWGRHWLDLVRYAESRGHEFDYNLPNAYQYRDYVIRAVNADVPYRQFVLEHLAGDLLPKPRLHPTEKFNESILGTGFFFLGEQVHSPVDICQDRADRLDNMLDVTGKTFLGLTVACARCHDHKFDAIAQKDYYALAGFLQSGSYRLVPFDTLEHNRRVAAELWRVRDQARAKVRQTLAAQLRPGVEHTAAYLLAARQVLAGQVAAIVAQQFKVDAALLGRWVTQLRAAAKDATEPLHAWTQPENSRTAMAKDLRKRDAAAAVALDRAEIIVDYANPGRDGWLPDGPTFGPGPVRAGTLRLGTDPARPVLGVAHLAAAERDPLWPVTKLAPGAENEPGALGGLVRAGRTLRTPSFQVKSGKVHLLVKGGGLSYAAVESHVMIAGPLHGQLVKNFKPGPRYQWVLHDLSATRAAGRTWSSHRATRATSPSSWSSRPMSHPGYSTGPTRPCCGC